MTVRWCTPKRGRYLKADCWPIFTLYSIILSIFVPFGLRASIFQCRVVIFVTAMSYHYCHYRHYRYYCYYCYYHFYRWCNTSILYSHYSMYPAVINLPHWVASHTVYKYYICPPYAPFYCITVLFYFIFNSSACGFGWFTAYLLTHELDNAYI